MTTKMTPTPNNKPAPVPASPTPAPIVAPAPIESTRTKNKWTLDNITLTCTFPNGMTTSFNVQELFPAFLEYSDTQKETICNGIHQKLGDSCARPKAEKLNTNNAVVQMKKTFEEILDGSAWKRKGGHGVIGLAKQLAENSVLLTQAERDEMNKYFAKMNMPNRI